MILTYQHVSPDHELRTIVCPEQFRKYVDDVAAHEIGKMAIKEATITSTRVSLGEREDSGATQLRYRINVFSDDGLKVALAKEYERGVNDEHRRRFTNP